MHRLPNGFEDYSMEMGHDMAYPLSESELWSGSEEDGGRSRRGVLTMFALLAVVVVAALAVVDYSMSGRKTGAPAMSVRAFGAEFKPTVEDEVVATKATTPGQSLWAMTPYTSASLAPSVELVQGGWATTPVNATNARRAPNSLKPHEDMHDGNPCEDAEELHGGLCYTRCATLTGGTHPFRITAYSCCATASCGANIFRMHTASIIPCSGYDVSSGTTLHGTACPHVPGTCLTDEEQFQGECFEKCSKLTNGAYPNRVAVATCCKKEGIRCLDPWNDWTAAKFDVGGGLGDHDAETPRRAHYPLKSLTETSV